MKFQAHRSSPTTRDQETNNYHGIQVGLNGFRFSGSSPVCDEPGFRSRDGRLSNDQEVSLEEQGRVRHLKSQISNVRTEIWNLRSEFRAQRGLGAGTSRWLIVFASGGLAARSLCHFELRNPG